MTGLYNEGMRDAWLEADHLGFDTGWGHDHLLNQNDHAQPEEEGWTILAALLALSSRIRGGLLVTANTFRHPAVLAKMATTIDRISNGRLDVGIGAGWMEAGPRAGWGPRGWRPKPASSAWSCPRSATPCGCSTRPVR